MALPRKDRINNIGSKKIFLNQNITSFYTINVIYTLCRYIMTQQTFPSSNINSFLNDGYTRFGRNLYDNTNSWINLKYPFKADSTFLHSKEAIMASIGYAIASDTSSIRLLADTIIQARIFRLICITIYWDVSTLVWNIVHATAAIYLYLAENNIIYTLDGDENRYIYFSLSNTRHGITALTIDVN